MNGDGKFDIIQSYNWWKNGEGVKVSLPLISLDLRGITPQELGNKIDATKTFNLQYRGNISFGEGLVHGQVTLKYVGNNEVKSFYGKYDFEMHPWSESPIRNVFTKFAGYIHGEGQEYLIETYGLAPISPSYNGIRKNRGY